MGVTRELQVDTSVRKTQLATLSKNLDILLEREAKYAGNAPLDLLHQIEDHRQAITLIKQVLEGSLTDNELEEALKPLLLALRDGQVIKITVPLPFWLRLHTWVIFSIAALTLGGVALLIYQNYSASAGAPPVLPTPDAALLDVVTSLEPNWAVSALTLQVNDNKSILWVGSESGSHYALYSLDPAQQAKARLQHALDLEQRIIGLAVDCKKNVWILLNEVGTRVYNPETGQVDTLLNIETTQNRLSKNTTFAIASRCLDNGIVEVWLGREGVHTLQYQADYPTLENITFRQADEDSVYKASQTLTNVTALTYLVNNQILWVADLDGSLLSIPLKGVQRPHLRKLPQILWSLGQSQEEDSVWVGAGGHLIKSKDEKEVVTIPLESEGIALDTRATALAVDRQWVWFGDSCPEGSSTCWPLGVYNHQNMSRVDIGNHKSVNVIVIDPDGTVWIGTDQGLIFYPGPAQQ